MMVPSTTLRLSCSSIVGTATAPIQWFLPPLDAADPRPVHVASRALSHAYRKSRFRCRVNAPKSRYGMGVRRSQ